jgi:hypothetical protein
MKKNLLSLKVLFVFGATILFFSCVKKKDDTAITPTYKETGGSNGNPNVGNVTVTGTATLTNPATQNSGVTVGGSGWSNPVCSTSSSLTLKGINGNIDVTLTFLIPPSTGNYAIATQAGPGTCAMTVVNAPNQPAGIVWYAKTGIVAVNTTTTSINAQFNGITCTQQNFNFPTVTLNGNIACN